MAQKSRFRGQWRFAQSLYISFAARSGYILIQINARSLRTPRPSFDQLSVEERVRRHGQAKGFGPLVFPQHCVMTWPLAFVSVGGEPIRSNPAPMILHFNAVDARKHACDGVAIDDLEHELDIGEHDIGGTGRDQIHALPVLLSCLDPAFGEFASQPVPLHDETAATSAG